MQSGPEFVSVLPVKILDLGGVSATETLDLGSVSDMETMDLGGMSVDSVHSVALESFHFRVLRCNQIALRLYDVVVLAHE